MFTYLAPFKIAFRMNFDNSIIDSYRVWMCTLVMNANNGQTETNILTKVMLPQLPSALATDDSV